MGYFRETVKGVSWMGGLRIVVRSLALLKLVILARILTPTQFGIFGIAVLVLGLLEVLTESGINVFLIQEKSDLEEYVSTAWIVSILRGFLISILIFISIPFIVSFFGAKNAGPALVLTAIIPLIRGFVNPSIVKFQKELQFNREFYLKSSLFFIEVLVAVVLAFVTGSELAMLFGIIASDLVEVAISFSLKPRPFLKFEKEKLKLVIERGKWITAAGLFNYAFHHLDDILVGRILGTSSLGIYQQAYKISTLPVSEVGEVFNKVTFPVYVNISADKERLKRAFIKTTLTIIGLVIPFGLILFLFPKEIILIALGDKWLDAVDVLRILAIFGVLKAISNSAFSVFLALKAQKTVTLITFVGILAMSIIIIPLITRYGIVGAAASTVFATLVTIPALIFYLFKVLK